MSPPALGRRAFGGLTAAALTASGFGYAADRSTYVSGWGLPFNLDPHQVFDVPMQGVMLNAYDGLAPRCRRFCDLSSSGTLSPAVSRK